MAPTGPEARVHRSQVERSAATRRRVLDAAIECLNDVGYARTTTTMIAERAGVSRGAQVHHFPTKAELVVEAVAHLARRADDETRRQSNRLANGGDRLSRFLDLLWESFSSPLSYATLELWVAARTDAELRRAVVEHERAAGRGLSRLWRDLAGTAVSQSELDDARELTFFLLRGMAVERILKGDDTRRRELFERWKVRVLETRAT
jgi:AcrR family transcriptional regulator